MEFEVKKIREFWFCPTILLNDLTQVISFSEPDFIVYQMELMIPHHRLIITKLCSVTQLCPTLCNPMDYSSPGSSVHGIFQARILE